MCLFFCLPSIFLPHSALVISQASDLQLNILHELGQVIIYGSQFYYQWDEGTMTPFIELRSIKWWMKSSRLAQDQTPGRYLNSSTNYQQPWTWNHQAVVDRVSILIQLRSKDLSLPFDLFAQQTRAFAVLHIVGASDLRGNPWCHPESSTSSSWAVREARPCLSP